MKKIYKSRLSKIIPETVFQLGEKTKNQSVKMSPHIFEVTTSDIYNIAAQQKCILLSSVHWHQDSTVGQSVSKLIQPANHASYTCILKSFYISENKIFICSKAYGSFLTNELYLYKELCVYIQQYITDERMFVLGKQNITILAQHSSLQHPTLQSKKVMQ